MENNVIEPIIDKKEEASIDVLTEEYNKLIKPGVFSKIGKKAVEIIPEKIKELGKDLGDNISEKEIYIQMMKLVGEGFKTIEEQASKYSINEEEIIKRINKKSKNKINSLDEVCLLRSYEIAKVVNNYKTQDIIAAAIEGASTGFFGFAGLPFNIVLSTFLFFRSVQSIAMFYGYDIKNDSSELIIANEIFKKALNPKDNAIDNETTTAIGKIMIITQTELVKQTAKKGWSEMASKGGAPLLIAQIRALASKAAQKALNKAGKKGLENNIFTETLELIGKKITLGSAPKLATGISTVFSAFIDTAQMKKVLEYADIFYQKRFILEKEERISRLNNNNEKVLENTIKGDNE